MTSIPRDSSRDPRIEVPSNYWLVHATAHALLPVALRRRVSANAVSLCGLAIGALAAVAFYDWRSPVTATIGLVLAFGWLVADGLDGMVARATRTASPLGRLLDGLCDHGVFILLYLAAGFAVGTVAGWTLAVAAGIAHAVQSTLYEGERARFHRRRAGDAGAAPAARLGTPAERLYDWIVGWLDRAAAPFDRRLATARDPAALGRGYADRAVAPLRAMIPLSANTRVLMLWLAAIAGDIRLFWWFELVPLTLLAIVAIVWHRRVEAGFIARGPAAAVISEEVTIP